VELSEGAPPVPASGIPGAGTFLDHAARRLVPGCDPAAVAAVLARASAGYAGAQSRDGRRTSVITPSGVPFEASVTGVGGCLEPALRYTTEAGTGLPFFGPRLAAQRTALDDLMVLLPRAARAAAAELGAFAARLFPDPGAVRARMRFATTVGVVHTPDVPGGPAGLKVYGNLTAEPGALARLAGADDRIAALAGVVDGLPFLAPAFATREVDAAGRIGHKLYLRTATATGPALSVLARRCGGDVGALLAELDAGGVDVTRAQDRGRWRCIACVAGPAGGSDPALSIHLTARGLGLAPAPMAALARTLAARHHGSTAGVDALDAAAVASGGGWGTTVVGVGLPRGGGVGKVNVYVAPSGS
jgi:hypothetical protein